jgi:regulator of PEP synthase PpsR (kinase-PPPase family)
MVSQKGSTRRYVSVASDATGATAERVVRAALAQFSDAHATIKVIPNVRTKEQVRSVVEEAQSRNGLIAYTLVSPHLHDELVLLANEFGLVAIDLLGPLITGLSEFLSARPAYQAGLYTHPGDEHYSLLESVSFTVHHDDGQRIHELDKADVVIVGPSRTSKTPLSVYLAHTRGLKVANVPLALGVEPFAVLDRLDQKCVVALTINADVLSRIRSVRQDQLGAADIEYASREHVRRELHFCHALYRRHPAWALVDVTGKAIEEIAATVCRATGTRAGATQGVPG